MLTCSLLADGDDEDDSIVKTAVVETAKIAASVPAIKATAQGLSMLMKAFLVACILGGCYIWVQAHSARRASGVPAGRHGAYEKSSSA